MSIETAPRTPTIDIVNHRWQWIAAACWLCVGLASAAYAPDGVASGSIAPPVPAAASSATSFAGAAPKAAANSVVSYLAGAEIQAETDAQRAELRRAFNDMLSRPADELRTRRYAGFDGTPAARSLPELLSGHVVPRTPQAIDTARFFEDTRSPAARRAVRRLLRQMKQ